MRDREKMWNGTDAEDHKVQEAWEAIRKSKKLEMLAQEENNEHLALRMGDKEIVVVRDYDKDIIYRRVKSKMEGCVDRKVNSERGRVRSLRAEEKATGDLWQWEGYAAFIVTDPKKKTTVLKAKDGKWFIGMSQRRCTKLWEGK